VVLIEATMGTKSFGAGLRTVGLAGAIALAAGARVAPPLDAGQPVEAVEITAERFAFTPSEIKLRPGASLELRLRSEDTDHGFHILGTDVNVLVPKRGRGEVVVRFVPPAPGRYTFECSKLCGAGHGFMRGVIVVSE
jgi:cytochrome c oxidase subunit 2